MPRSIVCDAGGILAAVGALQGDVPTDAEFLALDWSALTTGRFLAARHEGDTELIELEISLALTVVSEWFPVRTIVAQTLNRADLDALDALDSWSALTLAEQLALPLFTASDELTSTQIEILRPW